MMLLSRVEVETVRLMMNSEEAEQTKGEIEMTAVGAPLHRKKNLGPRPLVLNEDRSCQLGSNVNNSSNNNNRVDEE
jgi:hypothetical protein